MAYLNNSNKRSVETFLVSAAGNALYNTAGAGNNIVNGSGNIVLANKQLGFFSATGTGTVGLNVALDTTPTITEAPAIYLAQGTADSANVAGGSAAYPLRVVPYIRSGTIYGNQGIRVTKKAYAAPTHSIWVVGQPTGSTGEIVALDELEYELQVAYRGRREDEYYNMSSTASTSVNFTTPNYTALGTAQKVDHLIQNIVWQLDRHSKVIAADRTRFSGNAPIVAFAIDDSGAAGTLITGLTTGSVVPVVTTNIGTRSITLTADQATSIKAAAIAAGMTGTATILNVNLTTAGTATGGIADMIMVMALDADLAYEDRIPQVKVRLQVGLTSGFDYATTYHTEVVKTFEGSGTGRALDLLYKATHGQRKYSLDHTLDPVIEYPSPVVTTETYVIYNIEHTLYQQVDTVNSVDSPQRAIVLIPSADTAVITAFDTYMNSWLASANAGAIIV